MDNKLKYTPGPWHWEYPAGDALAELVASDNNTIICDFGDNETYYPTAGKEPNKADAKLIAAAPELLEALIEVIRISDRKHDAWDKAKQIIKKVTS